MLSVLDRKIIFLNLITIISFQLWGSESHNAFIWQGFSFKWKLTPHRLPLLVHHHEEKSISSKEKNKLRNHSKYSNLTEKKKKLILVHDAMVGKCPPDSYRMTAYINKVSHPDIIFEKKSYTFRIRGRPGDYSSEEKLFQIVSDLKYAVILNGFEIRSTSIPGFHIRALTLDVSDQKNNEQSRFSYKLKVLVNMGNSPDCFMRNHNNYEYDITIHYLIMKTKSQDITFSHEKLLAQRKKPSSSSLFSFLRSKERKLTRKGSFPLRENNSFSFIGLTAFGFSLENSKKYKARYVRDMDFFIRLLPSEELKQKKYHATMNFSNRGLVAFGYKSTYSLKTLLVEAPESKNSLSKNLVLQTKR